MDPLDLHTLFTHLVESEGFSLFDFEISKSNRGITRVFICAPLSDKTKSPTLEGCARISKKILDCELVETIIPGDSTLEVSSPGINRKLTKWDHFLGALNERVSIKYKKNEDTIVEKGVVVSLKDGIIQLKTEDQSKRSKKRSPSVGNKNAISADAGGNLSTILFADIISARIDFIF